ncbi:hypothetical protein ASE48_08350 [Mycobacterium sp. Root265]|nr:hypothetical protein ASE48_08350 [Mycobacterium sp. Root265]
MFNDEDPLSPRYALALIINLPKQGAFYASRRGGPDFRGWDEDRYALADLVDEMQKSNHYFLLANRDPSKPKPKAPKPYYRPDFAKAKVVHKPGSFAAMVVAAKAAKRKREEAEANGQGST